MEGSSGSIRTGLVVAGRLCERSGYYANGKSCVVVGVERRAACWAATVRGVRRTQMVTATIGVVLTTVPPTRTT